MPRLIFGLLALLLVSCGPAGEKADPFAGQKRRLDVPECELGFNPIPLERGDGTRLPGITSIPQGEYVVSMTRLHFLVRSQGRSDVTYIEHSAGKAAGILCTNLGMNDQVGFVFPGFSRWINGARETVFGRSFTFLWDLGTGRVAVEDGGTPEDPTMNSVLQFFNKLNVYDLGKGRYDIRGERLEIVGNRRFRTGASYEIGKR